MYMTIGTHLADYSIVTLDVRPEISRQNLPDDRHLGRRWHVVQIWTRTICWEEQAVAHIQLAELAELCKSRKHVCIGLPTCLCNGAAECHAE